MSETVFTKSTTIWAHWSSSLPLVRSACRTSSVHLFGKTQRCATCSIPCTRDIRTNLHTGNKDPRMELSVLKTIAGFLNTNGGTLIIGLSDDGTPVGIEPDGFPSEDRMSLHLVNIVKSRLGPLGMTCIHLHFEDVEDSRVMVVKCSKAASALFVKDGDVERFYIRMGPSTDELSASQTQEYVKQRYRD